jgi:DNA-binding NtrC family response regulator
MATVVVADDDRAIRKIVSDRLGAAGHVVEAAPDGRVALAAIERLDPDLVLVDLQMPELDGLGVLDAIVRRPDPPPVVVITAHGSIAAAVQAMRAGAYDFLPKPFEAAHLEHTVEMALSTRRLRRDVGVLKDEVGERHRLIAGRSARMREVLQTAQRAASSEATVLLRGESGTGKEVLARAIHAWSRRAEGPFVALNCAALNAELIESELFGHEKGAFTGAARTRPGRLEIAAGGTLFLDEIGELPPPLQAKLLRVVQEREFERVGGTRTLASNVRFVAATNRDLEAAVAAGTFRQDLYYRINVVSLQLTPLRERRDDIEPLAAHFVERFAREAGRAPPGLDPGALELLRGYPWPGNVRELGNVIERCIVLGDGATITADDLPEELHDGALAGVAAVPRGVGYHEAVVEAKRAILREALRAESGHQTRAARRLGLTQPYLARLLKNLQIR